MLPTAHRLGTMLWCGAQIKFYPGRYAAEKCSILPVGDPTQYIPDNEVRRFAVTKRFLLLSGQPARSVSACVLVPCKKVLLCHADWLCEMC